MRKFAILLFRILLISLICQLNLFAFEKIKNRNPNKVDLNLSVIYEEEKNVVNDIPEGAKLPPLKFEVIDNK